MKTSPGAKEIAVRIVRHLQEAEARQGKEKPLLYYQPSAYVKAGWVVITYNSKEGKSHALQIGDAFQYLNWLDAGNIGPHWVAQKYRPVAEGG